MTSTKNALLSVYDKNGIADFARELVGLDWSIYASGGTAKHLAEAGVAVTDVATIVGETMLNHKVVTLSREIHAGLLALTEEELTELAERHIDSFDMVCVDLYPLEETIAKGGDFDEVRKQTDIGGPTMISSGAKGRRIVIADSADRASVLEWLKAGEPEREAFLTTLEAKAQFIVSRYRGISADYLGDGAYMTTAMKKVALCKYGENGYQTPAALYADTKSAPDPLALPNFTVIQGTPLSYNNFCDIDRELQTITQVAASFDANFGRVPYIAIGVKHGNACGAGYDETDPILALERMLEGDVRAIFGGVVMLNFPLTEEVAEKLLTHAQASGKRLLDAIVVPSADESTLASLTRKGDKCRIVVNPALANLSQGSIDTHTRTRYVRGGALVQPNYTFVPNFATDTNCQKVGEISDAVAKDLLFARAIGATSNSNTITIVKDKALAGNGVGQQDRVGAAELAIKRADDSYQSLKIARTDLAGNNEAGRDLAGAVAYSDSFFPFPDAPAVLIDRGIRAICTTTGSVNDKLFIDLATEKNVALVLYPDTDARGFYMH